MNRTAFFRHGVSYAYGLDTGRRRKANQDRVICCPEEGFFAVADGMGGLPNGGEAAEMLERIVPVAVSRAVETLPEGFSAQLAGEALLQAIGGVSDCIYEKTSADGAIGFGSTLCALWLVDSCAVCLSIGDSRAYYLPPGGELTQLTNDHNMAGDMFRAGMLSAREAELHPASSKLTRFMGMTPPAEPELFFKRVQAGDRLLLCSDGLYGMLDKSELTGLAGGGGEPEAIVAGMIDRANARGGKDNISAILIKITGGGEDVEQ